MLRRCLLLLTVILIMITPILANGNYEEATPFYITPGDPNGFDYYFNHVYWSKNDTNFGKSEWMLVVEPSEVLRRDSSGWDADTAFGFIAGRFSDDYRWSDTDGMRRQFIYSVNMAKYAPYWALIPY